MSKIITIEIRGGTVIDVRGLPRGYLYKLIDHDVEDSPAHAYGNDPVQCPDPDCPTHGEDA